MDGVVVVGTGPTVQMILLHHTVNNHHHLFSLFPSPGQNHRTLLRLLQHLRLVLAFGLGSAWVLL
jgi:hypothetical protein